MPTGYEEFLLETKSEVIETRERYEAVLRRVADLTRAGRRRTPEETKPIRCEPVQDQTTKMRLSE